MLTPLPQCGLRPRTGLLSCAQRPWKLARPSLQPRALAFDGVFAEPDGCDELIDVGMLDAIAEHHLAHEQRLDAAQRERGILHKTLYQPIHRGLDLIGFRDPRDHAEFVQPRGRQRVPQQEYLARTDRPGDIEQLLRQEPARCQADLRERHAETRIRRRDDEVAVQGDFTTARDGVPLHDRDHRQRIGFHRVETPARRTPSCPG